MLGPFFTLQPPFTVAGLVTLQNLQNLASLQQSLPSLPAGLQALGSNAPLNLSVGASAGGSSSSSTSGRPLSNGAQQETPQSSVPPLLATQQPAPMPQLILASGQLVQGIQGAQLLIPTSQGGFRLLRTFLSARYFCCSGFFLGLVIYMLHCNLHLDLVHCVLLVLSALHDSNLNFFPALSLLSITEALRYVTRYL